MTSRVRTDVAHLGAPSVVAVAVITTAGRVIFVNLDAAATGDGAYAAHLAALTEWVTDNTEG